MRIIYKKYAYVQYIYLLILNYLYNGEPELTHYEFVASIGEKLGYYQTATTICFRKQANNTDINVGDKGFGLMFACYSKEQNYKIKILSILK